MADSIAARAAGSVTFAVPLVVAKTIVLWPPLNAGSLAARTAAAFCLGARNREGVVRLPAAGLGDDNGGDGRSQPDRQDQPPSPERETGESVQKR
jgi:hypothetical protein